MFYHAASISDKAQSSRSALHLYMGGSEIQTYSIMADADCLGKLIAGLITRLRKCSLLLWSCCMYDKLTTSQVC